MRQWFRKALRYSYLCLCLLTIAACTATYGSLQRSNAVSGTFERKEVLPDHNYYTAGSEANPTAILAIDRSYTLKSGLWHPVDMTSEKLARLVDAMTDQLGFTPAIMGSVILDPQGRQVGVWYSLYSRTTIHFEPDNIIAISLPSPDSGPLPFDRMPGRLH